MEKPPNHEEARPKPSQQRGYISEPIHTSRGSCFVIRWRVQNGDGSWSHRSERLYVSKKEARAILDQRLHQAAVAARPPAGLCVRDFVFNYWWPSKERQGLRPTTARSYQAIINNVVPPICLRPLAEVSPQLIAEVLRKRSRQAAPKTVLNEVRLLHSIFELALYYGLVERNPVRREHQPHLQPKPTTEWTLAQIRDIVAEAPAEQRALFTTAAVSELRFCELLNLSRDDLDFARQTLRVGKDRAGRKASRLVPVGPLLLQVLADHLERTPPRPPANLLFPDPAGGRLNPHRLKKALYLTLSRLRFPRRGVGFASFRSTRRALLTAPWGDPSLQAAVAEQRRLLATAPVASAWAQKRAVALALEQAIWGGASAAVPPQEQTQAAAADAQNVAKEGGKLRRIQLDIPPAGGGDQAAPRAAAAEAKDAAQQGEKPLPRRKLDIPRMRLEAFLGGGL